LEAIAADPTGPVSLAAYLRLVAEMTGAVCVTLVFAVAVDRWWLALLCAVAVCAVINLVLVGISPRTLGRHRPVAVLSAIGPFVLAAHRFAAPFARTLRPGSARVSATWESEDELQDMVDRVAESEHIEDDE